MGIVKQSRAVRTVASGAAALAVVASVLPESPAAPSELHRDLETVKQVAIGVDGYVQDSLERVTLFPGPSTPPPASNRMRVATFNIFEGGRDYAGVLAELKKVNADVDFIQEGSRETAQRLGKDLGMHAVVGGNWKVILSKYPIASARAVNFDFSHFERFSAAWQTGKGEPLEVRGLLDVTLQAGGLTFHAVGEHLSTSNATWQARQLESLTAYVKHLRAAGDQVIAGGDMNLNFNLAHPGVADPAGVLLTPTDTPQEQQDRYGRFSDGLTDARVRSAASSFEQVLPNAWSAGHSQAIVGGRALTPQAARAELEAGNPSAQRRTQLLEAIDGLSHLSVKARIDNLFTSEGFKVRSTTVDQDVRASDHQPVYVDLEIPAGSPAGRAPSKLSARVRRTVDETDEAT